MVHLVLIGLVRKPNQLKNFAHASKLLSYRTKLGSETKKVAYCSKYIRHVPVEGPRSITALALRPEYRAYLALLLLFSSSSSSLHFLPVHSFIVQLNTWSCVRPRLEPGRSITPPFPGSVSGERSVRSAPSASTFSGSTLSIIACASRLFFARG